jgi:hypothetical protein
VLEGKKGRRKGLRAQRSVVKAHRRRRFPPRSRTKSCDIMSARALVDPPLRKLENQSSPTLFLKCLQSDEGENKKLVEERQAVYARIKDIKRIPELDYTPSRRYTEAPMEEVLFPLIEASKCILVPGAYFGDEGKAKNLKSLF